jgi:negative regulator of flagellin synthesis FlgM
MGSEKKMQIYGPSHVDGPQSINRPHAPVTQKAPQVDRGTPVGGDQLDISSTAELVDKIHDVPDIRHDLVRDIRAAIADGTYETDGKLNVALDRLLDEIG